MAFSRLLSRYIDDHTRPLAVEEIPARGWYTYVTASFYALTSE